MNAFLCAGLEVHRECTLFCKSIDINCFSLCNSCEFICLTCVKSLQWKTKDKAIAFTLIFMRFAVHCIFACFNIFTMCFFFYFFVSCSQLLHDDCARCIAKDKACFTSSKCMYLHRHGVNYTFICIAIAFGIHFWMHPSKYDVTWPLKSLQIYLSFFANLSNWKIETNLNPQIIEFPCTWMRLCI